MEQDSEEKSNCCDDQSCHCACCYSPSFLSEKIELNKSFSPSFTEVIFSYEFKYSKDSYFNIFHPPLVLS